MTEFRSLLRLHASEICSLTDKQLSTLESHYKLLSLWNRKISLTTITEVSAVVRRHFCESLELAMALPEETASVLDVGSGAGFPGFPLAVLRPDIAVTLLDSNTKKCVFLRELSRLVGNVTICEARSEELHARHDWVASRAVSLPLVLEVSVRVARNVALLIGRSDLDQAKAETRIVWNRPKPLRTGENLVLLTGLVSRGTTDLTCST